MKYVKKKAAVLYHYPCPDGAFAALAAHLYFSATASPALFFPNMVYNPIKPEHLPLDELDEIYLLDFAGPPGFILDVSCKVNRVIVLDHHKTALEMLGNQLHMVKNMVEVIDINKSGATIAYDYFKQKLVEKNAKDAKLAEFERIRNLFEYIEDGDLWRWHLKDSKSFSSGLKDMKIEYHFGLNPDMFEQLRSLELEMVIRNGNMSLAHKQKLIDEVLEQAFEIELGGFGRCLAVNVNEAMSELRSELGHQLACKSNDMNLRGIGAVVYKVPELGDDKLLKISLRSIDDEDTTPISLRYGGGGHRNASSFMLSFAEFEKWKVN